MKALRAALEGADGPSRRETLARLGREYGVRIVPESERPTIGVAPVGPAMQGLQERLREGLGESTEVRIAPRARQLFVHMQAGDDGYWVGFPLPPRQQAEDIPTRDHRCSRRRSSRWCCSRRSRSRAISRVRCTS